MCQSTNLDEFSEYSIPSTTIVPAGELINIQCKVNTNAFRSRRNGTTEGLETPYTIVSIKSRMNHRLIIPVINNSKHDIFLPINTIIGRLQQISHIKLLQAKEKKTPDISIVQSSLNKDGTEMEEEQGNKDMTAAEIKEHQEKVLDSTDL